MKQKFKFKQSQYLVEPIHIPEIEKQIRKLKEEFRRVRYERVEIMYNILSKIISLRKQTNSKYGVRSLRSEKDINLTYSQLRLIFSFKWITENTKKIIKENNISDTSICFMLWRFKFLRESQWQSKLVKRFINNEISQTELSEFTADDLKKFLISGKKIKTNEKYLITSIKTLSAMRSRFKNYKILNSDLKNKLKKQLNNFLEDLNETKK